MYTSTLLCDRSLALAVPWNADLKRHQDWDWLIRASLRSDVTVAQCDEALVRIQTGSVSSISAGAAWRPSLDWADSVLRPLNQAVYVEFIVGQPLRYALSGRSFQGVRECLTRVRATRRWPSFSVILIALGGLIPRKAIEMILRYVR